MNKPMIAKRAIQYTTDLTTEYSTFHHLLPSGRILHAVVASHLQDDLDEPVPGRIAHIP